MRTALVSNGAAAVGLLLVLFSPPGGLHAQSISVGGSGCGLIAPSAPQDVSATAASGTSIKVTWRGPANGACVDVYRVTVTPKIQPRILSAIPPVSSQSFEVTVEGLAPATAYVVTVEAQSSAGNAAAGPLEVTTCGCNQDTTPAQVTHLKGEAQGGGKVFLSWGAPGNGACVDTYNVACSPLARTTAASAPKPVSGGSVTIEGLASGPHVCEVTAANGAPARLPPSASMCRKGVRCCSLHAEAQEELCRGCGSGIDLHGQALTCLAMESHTVCL